MSNSSKSNKQNRHINIIKPKKSRIRATQQYDITIYIEISILASLADGNIICMTNTSCSEYSIKTPDDGQ